MANMPAFQRSYSVQTVIPVTEGTLLETNQALFRTMAAKLILAGCTCYYSCDGVTAGAAGDGVNRLAVNADVVFDDPGNPHSWIVLQLPAGLGSAQLLLEATQNFGGAVNGDGFAWMAMNGWTGGTDTDIPTVDDVGESALPLHDGSGGKFPSAGNYAAHCHVIAATDGTSLRFVATDDATDDVVITILLIEKVFDIQAACTQPYGGTWDNTDFVDNMHWHGYATTEAFPANGALSIPGVSGGLLTFGFIDAYDDDGKLNLFPIGGTAGPRWVGYIPDLFAVYNDGTTHGKTIPSSGRRWRVFPNLVLPWDGSTDAGNGSTNAHVLGTAVLPSNIGVGQLNTLRFDALAGFGSIPSGGGGGGDGLGPVISLVAPPVGLLSEDRVTAIHTPVSFRLTDADGIKDVVITVLFEGANEPVVAFDDEGWRGRFAGNSTNSATPGSGGPTTIDFVVFPAGGWRANIEALKINGLDIFGSKEGVDV